MKKFSNTAIISVCGILLLFTFISGLKFSYDLGFFNGASTICYPDSVGVDQNGKIICFNELEQSNVNYLPYNINVSQEELEWR